ncbi:uncharacterized protein [Elaeis guineensis]|uniref:uncharacterized protein n=1 Tax=Elaeis guineensis var. tenera TaxID=51953 RepID=UPI003C6D2B6D
MEFEADASQVKDFSWSNECRWAFEDLKRYLASPPLLVKPEVGEMLYLYLATFPEVVSSVLVQKNESRIHQPIYYTSKVLHGAKARLISVGHPQSNDEVEVTNRTILHGLKTRLNEAKGFWVEELPSVLWAYRMMPRVPTEESPFNLAYRTEAMIPLEIGLPSIRVEQYREPGNSECRKANLDLLPELRREAQLCMASYRQKVAWYYNARVKLKLFRPGDLVLRKAKVSKPLDRGKLSPNWEGSYKIVDTYGLRAYRLETLERTAIPRTWNADNLRLYYQ